MIFNTNTLALLTIASAGLMAHQANGAPTMNVAERGFWSDVGQGWNEFKGGFSDGFNAEQDRNLAPEEGHKKRAVSKQDFTDVVNALRKMGVNVQKASAAHQRRDVGESLEQRGFWDDVSQGWDEFKKGFSDGFDAEQDRDLAPEEGHDKRSPYVLQGADGKLLRPLRLPNGMQANVRLQARDDDEAALDDIGSGIGKGFGAIKNKLFGGFDELKADADRLVHPPTANHDAPAPAPDADKRDSWEDDAGNVVGAIAGWGQDHIGRISFKRDSWEDDVGNIAGAGAGWLNDHIGRVDPSDLIPGKGLKKAVSRREASSGSDEDLLG